MRERAVSELPPHTAFGELLLSAEELAEALGKSRRWVYAQVGGRNGLPAYKLGRSLAFELAAVCAPGSPVAESANGPIAGKCCAAARPTLTCYSKC